MAKSFDLFGGWLKFFQSLNLGILIVFLYEFVFFFIGLVKVNLRPEMIPSILLLLLYLLMNAVFIVIFLMKIENQNYKNKKYLMRLNVIMVAGNTILYILTSIYFSNFKAYLFQLFFPSVFYVTTYFYYRFSKRAAQYYQP